MYCLPAICLMKCFTETEIKLYENEYTKAYLIHCGDVYANMYQIYLKPSYRLQIF